jgi:hypothetical protein
LLAEGGAAERQRRALAEGGMKGLIELISAQTVAVES